MYEWLLLACINLHVFIHVFMYLLYLLYLLYLYINLHVFIHFSMS